MEVIKNETKKTEGAAPEVDQVKVEQLKEEFDAMNTQLQEKKYGVALDKEHTTFLMEDLFENFTWKGYESYAITESHKQIKETIGKNGAANGKVDAQVVEAIFHFLKEHEGTGVDFAAKFKYVCDQFAVTINEINADRQSLRDLSLELTATEMGITVEQLVQASQQQGGMQ